MDHKDLDVWKKGIDSVLEIYRLSDAFPKTEIYGLTDQLRRAAVSIPSNIAEGAARGSDKEFIHFLYIALGSLAEAETQIIIAKRLEYIDDNSKTLKELQTVRKMFTGLIK
jgi:four helix bundle protein